jgi:hypothetical protein
MAFYFREFPIISYDLLKLDHAILIQNPLVRFRIQPILANRAKFFYDHTVLDGEDAQSIAFQYYGDTSYDWLIYLVNDMIDPQYDWPLDYIDLNRFVRKKYGSVPIAQASTHHYEQILQPSSTLFDGTFVPRRVVEVDANTYNTLSPVNRREVDAYTYEVELNDAKREIRIIGREYLNTIVNEIGSALSE